MFHGGEGVLTNSRTTTLHGVVSYNRIKTITLASISQVAQVVLDTCNIINSILSVSICQVVEMYDYIILLLDMIKT